MNWQKTYRNYQSLLGKLLLIVGCFTLLLIYTLLDSKHISFHQFTSTTTSNATVANNVFGASHKKVIVPSNEYYYMKDYVFIGDTSNLASINCSSLSIKLNKEKLIKYDNNILINLVDSLKTKNIYSLKNCIDYQKSIFPTLNQVVNWKGDGSFLLRLLLHPLMVLSIFIVLFYRKIFNFFTSLSKTKNDSLWQSKHTIILLSAIVILLILIVSLNRYYFLQDDNYAQFTPVLLHGLTDWYTNGTIPTYNPYQFAGVPTSAYSTYAFFYPITHIAYFIALLFNKNALDFNSIFTLIHFIIGGYFLSKILVHYKVNNWLTFAGSLAFIFCGFNLEGCRSWYYVAPSVLFIPLLYYYTLQFSNQQLNIKKIILSAIAIAMYAYGGNVQFWLYTCIICSSYYFFTSNLSVKNKVKTLAAIFVLAITLFLPQLLITLKATSNIARDTTGGESILNGFGSLFLPYILPEQKSILWGTDELKNYSKFLYHGAHIFVGISLVFLITWLVSNKQNKKQLQLKLASSTLNILFIIVTLYALGRAGILWPITAKLPLFNKFAIPFKFLIYVQFFGVIIGAQLLNKVKFNIYLSMLSILFIVINIFNTKDAFYVYEKNKNYYSNYAIFDKIKKDNNYRTLSFSVMRSYDAHYTKSLNHNFATMYHINSLNGYEPLFAAPVNIENFSNQYAAKYFIHCKLATTKIHYLGQHLDINEFVNKNNATKIFEDNEITIYENNKAEPIVQIAEKNTTFNPTITNKNNGVLIQLNNNLSTAKLTLAYQTIPGIQIFVNGKKSTYTTDAFNRIVLNNVKAASTIQLVYKPVIF